MLNWFYSCFVCPGFMPQRKRPASTPTTKAASESAPNSSAASTENKRAAL